MPAYEIAVFARLSCQGLFPCLTSCSWFCWQQGDGKAQYATDSSGDDRGSQLCPSQVYFKALPISDMALHFKPPADHKYTGQSSLAQADVQLQPGSPHLSYPPTHPAERPTSRQSQCKTWKKGKATCREHQELLSSCNNSRSPDPTASTPPEVSMLNLGAGGTSQQRGQRAKVAKAPPSSQVERRVMGLKILQTILSGRKACNPGKTDAETTSSSPVNPTPPSQACRMSVLWLKREDDTLRNCQASTLTCHLATLMAPRQLTLTPWQLGILLLRRQRAVPWHLMKAAVG